MHTLRELLGNVRLQLVTENSYCTVFFKISKKTHLSWSLLNYLGNKGSTASTVLRTFSAANMILSAPSSIVASPSPLSLSTVGLIYNIALEESAFGGEVERRVPHRGLRL